LKSDSLERRRAGRRSLRPPDASTGRFQHFGGVEERAASTALSSMPASRGAGKWSVQALNGCDHTVFLNRARCGVPKVLPSPTDAAEVAWQRRSVGGYTA
jgi:hypothetical protein